MTPPSFAPSRRRSAPFSAAEHFAARLGATSEQAYDWRADARPAQVAPDGEWTTWLYIAGRGSGKTRSGAEFIREEVMAGRMSRVALVGPTAADVRDVMVEGESGLMAVCDRYRFRPSYEPSKRKVTFPNGAIALCFSSEEPDRLRGPQADGSWSDEIGAWKYPDATWSNLQFGLRLGEKPRQIVTSTPRPTKLMRALMARAGDGVVLTRGTSYENLANLSSNYREIIATYEGTRLGRQEIMGELLTDTPGALWTYDLIEACRVATAPERLVRVVVAIDPAITANEDSNETGIIVAGKTHDGHGYVLADRSGRYSPHEWATVALNTFDEFDADAIVIETNQGGDMAIQTIRSIRKNASIKGVHASRNKITRAEPISSLYEQKRVHHVGIFPALEDQLTSYTPGMTSPDRLDALVWSMTDLLVTGKPTVGALDLSGFGRENPWKAAG
jgi:phage terminase large subunit-like protein